MQDLNIRLLKSILRSLDSLKASLDKHVETIREQRESTQRETEPQPPVVVQAALELPIEAREYYRSKGRPTQREKVWRWIRNTLEIAAVLVAIFLALLTYRTLQQVKRQADAANTQVGIMQRQLEATDRPWIKIAGAKPIDDLTFSLMRSSKPLVGAQIAIVVTNIGKTVALNVTIHARMTLTEDSDSLNREQSDVCNGVVKTLHAPVLTVFPNDEESLFVYGADGIPTKIDNSRALGLEVPFLKPPNSKLISPKFIGCVTYTYHSSSVAHHSGFRFSLEYGEKIPPSVHLSILETILFKRNTPHWTRYFVVGKSIPQRDLRVEHFFSGFDAD